MSTGSAAATKTGGRGRRVIVAILVVLFAVLAPVTTVMAWTHRTVLNTSAYVDTIAPIGRDPAVIAAVSTRVTDELYSALNPQAIVAQALPPKAAFLAGPITNGARGYVESAVAHIVASQPFQQLWIGANRFAHQQLVALLRGHTTVVQATNGNVVINVVPLLAAALSNLGAFVSNIVGHPITLPQLTGTELPAAACARLSSAIGRPLPSTCGQIVLFRANNLATIRRGVQIFDRGTLALVIVTPLLAAAALAISRRRRRTLLQLTIGAMLGLVVVRRLGFRLQDKLIQSGPPENKDARAAIVHHLLHGLFNVMWWMLIVGLVIVAVAWVTGPYRSAVATRRVVGNATAVVSAAARGKPAPHPQTVSFVGAHFDLLRIGGFVVAVLLLLAVNVNFWSMLVILGLLAVYEVVISRLRPPGSVTLPVDRAAAPPVPTAHT